jgi:uncharacterized protein
MSPNPTASSIQATPSMTPVRPRERITVVDILRGFSILGILLVNMLSYAGYQYRVSYDEMSAINRAASLFIKFVAQAKFYTLFSFLFGWGMAIQMERAAQRGARFVPHYVRRLLILLLIGLVHAILVWDGDILITYAVLGLPLLLFRKCSDKTLLVAVAICMLIPVLLSTPGPAESFREAYAAATEPFRQEMMAGYYANVHVQGSYLEVIVHRLKALRSGYTGVIYWGTHVFGMFLLGLYVGRRRILHDIPEHLPLFRKVMWWGLIVGVVLNLVFVTATASPDLVPPAYQELATRGARTIGGPALCLFYISVIVLLVQKHEWQRRLSPLASVGRTALSNYLLQSIVCTLIFYGYGLGLYGRLGPAITLVLTFIIYRVQISLSGWWLDRYRFGPAEWLWRSLTYGKFQPLAPERRQRTKTPDASLHSPQRQPGGPDWPVFVMRRLLFIAVVAFAIVYFCVLGLGLSTNSTAPVGRTRTPADLAGPALDETIEFFEDALHGNLGYVVEGITQRTRVPVTELLANTFVKSGSLLVVAIAFATAIGVSAGGLAATRSHTGLALSTLTLTVIGVSIPSFFLALLFQVADIKFYQRTGMGLFPVYGISGHRTESLLPQVVAPALVLAARPVAHITRVTFVSISEILNRDFIRTARAKGLGESIVFWRHTLRNAGVSILTAVIVSFRFALGSLPVVEIFFSWPGLGVTMLNAIYERRTNVVAALALSLGVTFLLINLLVDLIYRFIDPRLRTQVNGGDS